MLKKLIVTLVGLCVMMAAEPVRSEESYDIGEVVVSAGEDEVNAGSSDATGFVTVIHAEDLPSQATSIPEVLDQTVGVNVKQYGGLGSYSTISIRGSSSEQVVIYLDGILLNRAVSGVVNLADIPLDNVEKIEVYRGTSPARFGASGIGGVVNIITKKGEKDSSVNLSYMYGSFNTHKTNLFFSRCFEKWHYNVFYNYTSSDGDFEFKDDRGTRYNRDDDREVRRQNNDFRSNDLLLKGGLELSSGYNLDVNIDTFTKDQGVPGIGSYQSEHARLKTFRNLSHFKLSKDDFIIQDLYAESLFSYSFQRQKFRDLQGEIGFGRQDNRDETENFTGRLLLSYMPAEWNVITVLGEASAETFQSDDRLASLGDPGSVKRIGYLYGFTGQIRDAGNKKTKSEKQKRRSYTVSMEDELYLFNDRLLINPSLKYNYYDNDFKGRVPFSSAPVSPDANTSESQLTRKIGMVFNVVDAVRLKGNVGKYYRIPNFYELFGDRGAIVGNTTLKPEEGINWDAGLCITLKLPRVFIKSFNFEYSYFNNNVDNLILFIQNSQRTSIAMNISKAKITGHEFFWRLRFQWPLMISGNYTIQHAKDKSSVAYWRGNTLPGRPKHQLFNRVEVLLGRVRIFHEIDFMGESFLDRANTREIDRRVLQNLGLSLKVNKHSTLSFEVKNITDERTEDVIGYPLPGRSCFVSANISF